MSDPTTDDPAADPLAALEADLAAVEAALGSLDGIDLEGRSGPAAVAEIEAAVSAGRFDRPVPGAGAAPGAAPAEPSEAELSDARPSEATDSELVGDGLVDEQVDPGPEVPGPA